MRSIIVPRIKAALGFGLYALPVWRYYFRDKFLITAFHRVNNTTIGDGISCTPANFRKTCEWLARHFKVVSLSEQVRALENGQIIPRSASITFDDGYLDNFEIAAPILRELGLPATFFISTGMIGTGTVPYWDARRAIDTNWMTWEHVRSLLDQGFEIECHTSTHIDMGKAEPSIAEEELRHSTDKLRDVGAGIQRLFAYPFGGKANITQSMRKLVMAKGFRCCVSCYGGINRFGADPFRLVRVPVNENYRYPYEFGLEILRSEVAGRFS